MIPPATGAGEAFGRSGAGAGGAAGAVAPARVPPPNDEEEEDEDEDEEEDEGGWVQWFCRLEGHEFFVEVDLDYIQDAFNMFGLRAHIDNFDRALVMVSGAEAPEEDDLMESEIMDLYRDATDLYGLVHARYILSPRGLHKIRDKFLRGKFGYCPRAYCNRQLALPVGLSDDLRTHRVRIYCPKCQETYDARTSVDGAYFGTSLPGIFLQTYPSCVPLEVPAPFVPKIFGFRVHGKRSAIELKLEKGEYGLLAAEQYLRSVRRAAVTDGSKEGGELAEAPMRDGDFDPRRGRGGNFAVDQDSAVMPAPPPPAAAPRPPR